MPSTIDHSEIVRRGEALYYRDIRSHVEPAHFGKFLVIDIETGEYEIDANEVEAIERMDAHRPTGQLYIKRIGFATAHGLGRTA